VSGMFLDLAPGLGLKRLHKSVGVANGGLCRGCGDGTDAINLPRSNSRQGHRATRWPRSKYSVNKLCSFWRDTCRPKWKSTSNANAHKFKGALRPSLS
jgi:hypothetical protein